MPDVFWSLTWADYDSLAYHHELQRQARMEEARLVAWQVYNSNLFGKNAKPLKTPADYFALPLVDGGAASTAPTETPQQTWARLQEMGLL